jgi:hypothetical protein
MVGYISENPLWKSPFSTKPQLIVWTKTDGMGTFYRSRHELIFVFEKSTSPPETGRCRTNVREYPGFDAFRNDRDDELAMHPTIQPVAVVAEAIKGAPVWLGPPLAGAGSFQPSGRASS